MTYAFNAVSATTGMRRGELLGLKNRNVLSDHITVAHSWSAITHYPENQILPRYYRALERIGITKAERVSRGLKFHSWRHFFNTLCLVENITYTKVQSVIGHRTAKMTENYTHLRIEDFRETTDVQARIFSGESRNV